MNTDLVAFNLTSPALRTRTLSNIVQWHANGLRNGFIELMKIFLSINNTFMRAYMRMKFVGIMLKKLFG